LFCSNYISYFLITWLPYYLVRERNFSMSKMAVIAGVSYFSAAGVGTLSGWLSDRWIDAGASPTRVRKTFTAGGMTIAAAFLVITVIAPFSLCAPALVCATIGFGICASNLWAITQTLAGPQAAGRWTGMQNFVGNLSGIVAPALTGFVLDRTGRFLWPFSIAGLVALLGATFWVFVVGRVEPVQWGSRARAHAVV
jgi:sugar phosphate permease